MTWAALLVVLKPYLASLLGFVLGWLFPSPLEKAMQQQKDLRDAERKATESGGNMSDLDDLP